MILSQSHQKKIDINNVSVSYGKTLALQEVSGTFEPSTLTAIVGPNGGGKSTLLKAIQSEIKVSSGSITHNCKHVCESSYLPQQIDIDKTLPFQVEEAVGMGLWPRLGSFCSYSPEHIKSIEEALYRVGLLKIKKSRLDTLSGGQFQRMMFARMDLQNASLLILDEPFTAVDSKTCDQLIEIILEWNKRGKTILVVLHNLDLVKQHFPQTLLLGRSCVGWGPTQDVLTKENMNKAFQNLLSP